MMNQTKLLMTAMDTTKLVPGNTLGTSRSKLKKAKSSPRVPKRTAKHKTIKQDEDKVKLIFGLAVAVGIPAILLTLATLLGG